MLETLIAGIIYGNVNLSYNHPTWPNGITFGNSVAQNEQLVSEPTIGHREEVRPRERVERASRGGSYQSSYKIIGTWNVKDGCVPYAWSQGMQTRGYGLAKNYPVTQEPQKFAITYEGVFGHAVVIEEDLGDKVVVRDANYIPYKITRRIIPKSIIKGYLS